MASRLLWRRSATALGIYASALFGFLGTIVAARSLGVHGFGLYAIVMAATGFFQSLLDLTVEEAVTKYGFRYSTAEEWGRLRRLFTRALTFKGSGAVLAGAALALLAPLADSMFGASGLRDPLLVAALLPLAQAPEGLAGVALILRDRYDLRGLFYALSMGLRLAGLAVGVQYGVVEAMLGVVAAQVVSTAAVGAAGIAAFGRFPAVAEEPLTEDAPAIRSFVFQSSVATGVLSLRGAIAPMLLGIVTSPAQVAYFRAALAPQQGFSTLSAPVRIILLTEQTRDWERGERESVFAGVLRYTARAALVMGAVVPLLLVFMPDVIELVFGRSYLAATDAARLVVVAGALLFAYGWTKSFPVSIGRPNLRVVTHGLETAVLVPLVVVLGAEWGATGAAAALLVASAVFCAHWSVLFLRLRREPWHGPAPREAPAQ